MRKSTVVMLSVPLMLSTALRADSSYGEFLQSLLAIFSQTSKPHVVTIHDHVRETILSIDEFCIRVSQDLAYLEPEDSNAIMHKIRTELERNKTTSLDQAYQIKKSALLAHKRAQAHVVAAHYFYDEHKIQAMVDSQEENLRLLLEAGKANAGSDLAKHFGKTLLEDIEKASLHAENAPYLKPEWQSVYSTEPSIPQPHSMPRVTPLDVVEYQKICDAHEHTLKNAGLSDHQISEYKKAFFDTRNGCTHHGYTSIEGIVRCSKCKISDTLLKTLQKTEAELYPEVRDKSVLAHAVQVVAGLIRAALPDTAAALDANSLKPLAVMKEEVIVNMGVTCSICLGEYRDELRRGDAGNKVTLPCDLHHACTDCAPTLRKCPVRCPGTFEREELIARVKSAQAHSPMR